MSPHPDRPPFRCGSAFHPLARRTLAWDERAASAPALRRTFPVLIGCYEGGQLQSPGLDPYKDPR